jgi:hypothetical protein
MKPLAVSGTPDGLGALTQSQRTAAGLAFLVAVVYFLKKQK